MYLDIAGHQVWVTEIGTAATTIVLLHGGMGHSDQLLETIGPHLAKHYRVLAYDRRGHGRTADTGAPFDFAEMVDEAIAVVQRLVRGRAHFVGWSDGGIVSLLLSLRRPELIARQVLIGANYHVSGVRELPSDTELGKRMREEYAARSPDGVAHFAMVARKLGDLYAHQPTLTTDDLRRVEVPSLVLAGDDDLIELSHTTSLFEHLPRGQLAIVPAASHAVALEAPEDVARLILHFLRADEPPVTMMPSRRHQQV
jgi:pimeloyl-ACP methyl ester carboxylesterase